MAKFTSAPPADMKYGVLFTNHSQSHCRITLTASEIRTHPCLRAHDTNLLLGQQHTPLFEEVGIDIAATCSHPGCPHQV